MSVLAELADELLDLAALAKAAEEHSSNSRPKLTRMLIERWEDEGVDRIRRPAGSIGVMLPSPQVQVDDPDTLAEWLDSNGHGHLALDRVEVSSHERLAELLRAILTRSPASTGPDLDDDQPAYTAQDAIDLERDLVESLRVVREPARDWHEHLNWQASSKPGSHPMATPDGEVIPGATYLVPEPRSIQVRPSKEHRERAGLALIDLLPLDQSGEGGEG